MLLHITYTKSDIMMIPIPIVVSISALYTYLGKRWYIANMLSSTFAYSAIEAIKLHGVVTGAALLARWFLHDIFWVFGTPVVSDVAEWAMRVLTDRRLRIDGEFGEEPGCADQGEYQKCLPSCRKGCQHTMPFPAPGPRTTRHVRLVCRIHYARPGDL